jgi:peptidoglycan/LPS O-acetylase OafA/YrhL
MGGRAVERVETRPQAAAPLAPDAPTSGGRIATLDGLRGLAILLVMFSHFAIANPPTEHWINQALSRAMRTGWIGVDLFFVLSGFLITGILVDARGHAGYFRNFYMRRVLRIFPLYYASLLVLVVVLPTAVGPTPGMVQMQADAAWYWLYLANIKIAVSGWPAPPEFIGHFWSLAVEEQFYLIWPLLVLLLSTRAMVRCCVLLVVAALAVRVTLLAVGEVTATTVLTPARLDALAIGALVALLSRRDGGLGRVAREARAVGLACGLLVLAIYLRSDAALPAGSFLLNTVGYPALAGFFAALMTVAIVAPAHSRVARVWSWKPLVFLGRYSYALYVIHPAVIYFWPTGLMAGSLQSFTGRWILAFAASSTLMLVVCVALALASWHGLEKHFLRLRMRFADSARQDGTPERRR